MAVSEKGSDVTYEQLCDLINENNSSRGSSSSGMEMYDTKESSTTTGSSSEDALENSASSKSFSETDAQVDGVAEGDVVKTDGNYIYTLRNTVTGFSLVSYKASGADTCKISKIKVEQADFKEMYLSDNKLFLIASDWETDDKGSSATEDIYYDTSDGATSIYVYDISSPSSPKQLYHLTQSGSYSTSRLSDGYLYTCTNYSVRGDEKKSDSPSDYVPKVNGKIIPSSDIYMPCTEPTSTYMVMTSLALAKPSDFTDMISSFGGSDTFYVSTSHIYATEPISFGKTNKTSIARYTYKNGRFTFDKSIQVRGSIDNSYYMHEYKDNFSFIYSLWNEEGDTSNGLCILDQNMKSLGEISDLGKDEEIYSSYYIDNMAYFVTYRNTDPVFAVDMSNPRKPVLKSKLKLPGFSSYLHSFGDNLLLGIGSDDGQAERVKFSMFSISSSNKLTEVTKKLLDSNTTSYASSNHKSIFIDEERSLIGLTVEDTMDATRTMYRVYSYKDKKFSKKLSLSVADAANSRGVRIGEYFYVVDAGIHVTVYDMKSWKILASV